MRNGWNSLLIQYITFRNILKLRRAEVASLGLKSKNTSILVFKQYFAASNLLINKFLFGKTAPEIWRIYQ